MKFDLKTPCKNCPFRSDATAIRFYNRARAEEIELSAYRNGFPCHLSAEHIDEDEAPDGVGGYGFDGDGTTQHCAGALLLYLRHGSGNVPFEHLPEDEQDKIAGRMDYDAPVYENEQEFLDSYGPEEDDDDQD